MADSVSRLTIVWADDADPLTVPVLLGDLVAAELAGATPDSPNVYIAAVARAAAARLGDKAAAKQTPLEFANRVRRIDREAAGVPDPIGGPPA